MKLVPSAACFGKFFIEFLKLVAEKKGKYVGFVSRWYPSSKTCTHCGHVHSNLNLGDRRWRCPNCYQDQDRDLNAAINIRRQRACPHVGVSSLGRGNVSQNLGSAIAGKNPESPYRVCRGRGVYQSLQPNLRLNWYLR